MLLKVKKRYIALLLIVISFLFNNSIISASDNQKTLIYFYSTTCSSCFQLNDFINNLKSDDLNIIKYSISEADNKGLLNSYCDYYKVEEDAYGMVPIIFFSDKYLFGKEDIESNLINILQNNSKVTPLLSTIDYTHDIGKFKTLNIGSVFMAGLVNGINPCSLSMLIFLITIVTTKSNRILRLGLSFVFGKFITFFFLGILFFTILKNINFFLITNITKYIIAAICLIFVVLNLYDFIVTNKMKHEKIKLKLPNKLISINHKLMKGINNNNIPILVMISYFVLGALISCGEFLCTGQVYLATIVSMIKSQLYQNQAIFYLLLFDIAFILPPVTCLLVIAKGKSIYQISNLLVSKMKYIKLINALFFLAILVFYLTF